MWDMLVALDYWLKQTETGGFWFSIGIWVHLIIAIHLGIRGFTKKEKPPDNKNT